MNNIRISYKVIATNKVTGAEVFRGKVLVFSGERYWQSAAEFLFTFNKESYPGCDVKILEVKEREITQRKEVEL